MFLTYWDAIRNISIIEFILFIAIIFHKSGPFFQDSDPIKDVYYVIKMMILT